VVLRRSSVVFACACLLIAAGESAPPGAMSQNDSSAVMGAGGSAVFNPSGSGGAAPGAGSGGTSGTPNLPGGAPGSGGSGASANGAGGMNAQTGSGGASGSGTNDPLDAGNYFASGAWHGYVWTSTSGAGSTIVPMDFSTQTTGMPRCVKGSVAAAADFSGTAILGFNLSEGNGATSTTVTPMKDGVLLDVTNNAGSPLRFQVKSAASGGTEWCTSVSGSGGFIPWTSLRTNCWDDTGTAYNREPIASAMLLVPGTDTAPVDFDFCWNSLVEADAPAGGGSGGAGGTGGTGSAGTGAGTGGTPDWGDPTIPPLTNGCDGYATRYWDCCKPHCGWSSNSPSGALASCDASDNSLGSSDAANSCEGGPAYLCHSNAPWAVSDTLAYGFTAVAAFTGADVCGKCFQLDFTGGSQAGSDPGSAALLGKSMIVQAINIGGDVGSGQFDIAIPGGGVGAYNACSTQWSASASELGATYGGFLDDCKHQSDASDLAALKNCVKQKCASVFDAKGLTELAAGCRWFVDWFQAADNPKLKYAQVACPDELMNRGIHRGGGGGGGCL
jgi:hypothetical protein